MNAQQHNKDSIQPNQALAGRQKPHVINQNDSD